MKPSPVRPRVLVVDDEDAIRRSLTMMFEFEGFDCETASSGPEAVQVIDRAEIDLVVLDVKMAGLDGLDTLRLLRERAKDIPVIMLSGHGTVKTAVEATRLGAFDFLEKPPETEKLLVAARNALEKRRLVIENRRLRLETSGPIDLVGSSAAIQQVFARIRRTAPTNATVLIRGESGVGKELVAREVHRLSARADESYVSVNCAAIPEELIESELFGHEKGSFTGATERQVGKFEMAHKGTIFLDEIGDMSSRAQAKVLRVLQEGEVERIGSQKTIKVDVRVIAATNKNLEQAIAEGTFREDLFFRLSVIDIEVPPLRNRLEDIPAIASHFVALAASQHGVAVKRISADFAAALRARDWRGNVRELRNVIDRLMILVDDDTLRADHLDGVPQPRPLSGVSASPLAPGGPPDTGSIPMPQGSLREFKEGSERAFIVSKLRENAWNISATAQAIDTPRSNLYKKLEQYGISEEQDGLTPKAPGA
ncbi:MAG: sigma-54-dependent Fis family transcriptional regulator [Vicinamibacteria bacterium]|nr:sigma-54-dependent Fis family transcriptional regulator [Vicinamibacteria bacterium]